MELNKIKIQNYKSLKNTLDIDISQSLVTLVGKNGSGKTNILDGLFSIFDYRSVYDRKGIDFRILIRLSDEEIEEYTKNLEIKDLNPIIEAYHSSDKNELGININRIKSTFLNDLLNQTETSIYCIANDLKEELQRFNKVVKELSDDSGINSKFSIDVDFSDQDISNSTNYGWLFSLLQKDIEDLIVKMKDILSERKTGDELIVSYHYLRSLFHFRKHTAFELKYNRPKLTKFESKHITINEEAIKLEIEKINKKTLEQRKKIDTLYTKLEEKLTFLSSIIDQQFDKERVLNDQYDFVLKKIITVCNPKIYYLRNENAQLFFKNENNWNSYYRSMDEKTILETFLKYKYTVIEQNDLNKRIEEKKLSDEEIRKLSFDLESFINENIPPYEKEMIKRIKVSDKLVLSIVERSGDEIPFNSTNSGRRWFYTYFFVKGCLQPGDILLMDEPANNLHPEAQIHIRKEIEEISKRNKIVISTHSPYMISPKSFVYYVEMTDTGTNLDSMDNIGIHQMSKNLGIFDRETVIGDILINNQLLPFEEIGKRLKEVFKEIGMTQQRVADKYGIDERALRRKLTGKHLTFNDIEWFIKTYNINPVRLLLKNHIN